MILKRGGKIAVPVLILLAAVLFPAACGKKAPPRPPGQEENPAAVENLTQSVNGDTLRLTWGIAGNRGAAPAGFYVYRSRTRSAEAPCPGCPLLFERAAVIPWREPQGGDASPRTFEYRETLESGYRYVYKVAAYYPGGQTGRDSATVEVVR